MKTIIKNGKIVTDGASCYKEIAFENGIITAIEDVIEAAAEDKVIDAGGALVCPGFIDSHVHYTLPGTADNVESGSKLAAFGGVTTYIDYVTPLEEGSESEAIEQYIEKCGEGCIDYTFHAEIMGWKSWDDNTLKEIKEAGINSIKVYTTYGTDEVTYEGIRALAKAADKYGIFVEVHAEDDEVCAKTAARFKEEGLTAPCMHGKARPAEAEIVAVKKMIEIAREENVHIHIVHVSTGEAAELIREAVESGIKITAETCPHYLVLDDSEYDKEDACFYIMTPPLRDKESKEKIWENLMSGIISSVVTDHCSFSVEKKRKGTSCFDIQPGIGGTETMAPILHHYAVGERGMSVERFVDTITCEPAKLCGIYPQKGTLQVGSDADIVIFDENREVTIDYRNLHSESLYSVYEGYKVKGWPVTTICRGEVVCHEGEFFPGHVGKFVKAVF